MMRKCNLLGRKILSNLKMGMLLAMAKMCVDQKFIWMG
jgi:hypothetical protein